jgi:hypothetical protein
VKNFQKFFLKMIPLGVKIYGEFDFDVFEVTKRFPDSGKTWVLKRKVAQISFFASIQGFLNQGRVLHFENVNSDSPHVFTPIGVISRNNFLNNFHVGGP